jgi:hypothetical protein
MRRLARHASRLLGPLLVGVLAATACGATRALPQPLDLAITAANLTECVATVPASPVTCDVAAVIANTGRAATTLDYSRLLLRDAQGGSYPPVAPTGVATVAAGGTLPVTLSFVIFETHTPTRLELVGDGTTGGSVSAALAPPPVPSPAATSPPPPRPTPHKPKTTSSRAAPATSTAPAYVPPPVYAPPPAYYAPPPNPVSGGFGNG